MSRLDKSAATSVQSELSKSDEGNLDMDVYEQRNLSAEDIDRQTTGLARSFDEAVQWEALLPQWLRDLPVRTSEEMQEEHDRASRRARFFAITRNRPVVG